MNGCWNEPLKPLTAISIGQVTHDRYKDEIFPGGCAFYGAMALQSLGAEVKLVTAFGEDFKCEKDFSGLTVLSEICGKTTTFVNTYPTHGPRIQWIEAAAPKMHPSILRNQYLKADILFFAPVFGEINLAEWLDLIDAKIVGLGLQGLMKKRGSAHPDIAGRNKVTTKKLDLDPVILKKLDVVFLSEEDIEVFGDKNLLEVLQCSVPLVVVTCGEQGSVLFQDGKKVEIGVVKTEVVDTTGAGDTFAASFLFGLAQGCSPIDAAHLGAAASSIIIEGIGGAALPRIGEAYKRIKTVSLVPTQSSQV